MNVETDDVTADVPQSSVLSWLLAACLSDTRAHDHLRAGRVTVDGQPVTDPDTPAGKSARVVLRSS